MREPAPLPGDFGVVATGGWEACAIRKITRRPVNHAILCVGQGQIVEGEPHGAALASVTKYPNVIWARWPLDGNEREVISGWGRDHVGTPYSWLDDLEIGMVDLFGWAPGFMRDRLASTKTLMCSQLVDAAYQAAGVQLFADRRPAGGVSPGDLWDVIQAGHPLGADAALV